MSFPIQNMTHNHAHSAPLVDALQGVFGKHPSARASHAKGVSVSGLFRPHAQAWQVTNGEFWQQHQVPVQGRFSVGGGNPKASDKGKTVRGLALHLGSDLDLVMISAPVFMVATPEEFIGYMAARRPDPTTGQIDAQRVQSFNAATPSTQALMAYLESTPVPASYAQTPYFGVNAFVFTNDQGQSVHGRWRAEPKAGRVGLNNEQLARVDDDFLSPELQQRLLAESVVFDLWLQLAQDGDDVRNPTIAWPEQNPNILMGQIEITALTQLSEVTMFNPALLPKGIRLSEDPTLQVRASAYAESLRRRNAS